LHKRNIVVAALLLISLKNALSGGLLITILSFKEMSKGGPYGAAL
jgi:hypothetical protein